jgi:hypothetical protein|uniref:Uncharacterized protein n=1 Tax=viral metagenome TaxID=1070528 RepID=A0A6C0H1X1_9ZZZZ
MSRTKSRKIQSKSRRQTSSKRKGRTQKRRQRGGDCGCNQKLYNGGSAADLTKFSYPYNMRETDPVSPSSIINSRNLLGGKKQRNKSRGGGLLLDFGTTNGALNSAQLMNQKSLNNDSVFPVSAKYTPIV